MYIFNLYTSEIHIVKDFSQWCQMLDMSPLINGVRVLRKMKCGL